MADLTDPEMKKEVSLEDRICSILRKTPVKSAQVSQALAMALLHEVPLNQTRHVEPEDKTKFSELTKGVVNPEALAIQQPHEEQIQDN